MPVSRADAEGSTDDLPEASRLGGHDKGTKRVPIYASLVAEPNAFPDFVWSIGEEGSDPIVMRQGERYRQDQFAESGHD